MTVFDSKPNRTGVNGIAVGRNTRFRTVVAGRGHTETVSHHVPYLSGVLRGHGVIIQRNDGERPESFAQRLDVTRAVDAGHGVAMVFSRMRDAWR